MKKLNFNPCDHVLQLQEIINSKRSNTRLILTNISGNVLNRYDDYERNISSLELLSNSIWTPEESNALITCYESQTKVLKKIKKGILESNTSLCQYCGINSVMPLDHYLPKELFPEYSIFTLNLIPCCSDCNLYKGGLWLGTTGNRQFINYYFDPVDKFSEFLTCSITSAPNNTFSCEFNLNFNTTIAVAYQEIIKNHFNQLKLIERYKKSVNERITSRKDSIINAYKRINFEKNELKGIVKDYLLDSVETSIIEYGVNSWKTALDKGLSESDDFIEFCIAEAMKSKQV